MSKPVHSIAELMEAIKAVRDTWGADASKEIWYRGVDSTSHSLIPGAYRAAYVANYDEQDAYLHFRAIAHTQYTNEPRNQWEWYFLMQHYGLPTRLLDWTDLPLVAAYFAIAPLIAAQRLHRHCASRAESAGDPCIWVLDATSLNERTWPTDGGVVCPRDDGPFSRHWLPQDRSDTERHDVDVRRPIAIYPARRNPRVIAQSGTFTVHGTEQAGIETLMSDHRIRRITLDRTAATSTIWSELKRFGVEEHRIFPELDRLALYVRDFYT